MTKGDNKEKVNEITLERVGDDSQEKRIGDTGGKYKRTWILRTFLMLCLILTLSAAGTVYYWPNWWDEIIPGLSGQERQSVREDIESKKIVERVNREVSARRNPNDKSDITNSLSGKSIVDGQIYKKIDQLNFNFRDTNARVLVLERRVEELAKLLSKKPSQNVIDNSKDINKSEDKFGSLHERLSLIEKQFNNNSDIPVLEGRINNNRDKNSFLEEKINSLDDRLSSKTLTFVLGENRSTLLIFSVSQLVNAISTSEPFTIHLKAIEMVAGENPKIMEIIKDLRPFADKGVETESSLKTQFLTMGKEIEKPRLGKDSLLSEIEYQLKSLVKVRKIEGVDINSFDGIILDAENAIKQNNLKAAVERISSLPKHKIEQLDIWLSIASSRVKVDSLVNNLKAMALTTLTKGG